MLNITYRYIGLYVFRLHTLTVIYVWFLRINFQTRNHLVSIESLIEIVIFPRAQHENTTNIRLVIIVGRICFKIILKFTFYLLFFNIIRMLFEVVSFGGEKVTILAKKEIDQI